MSLGLDGIKVVETATVMAGPTAGRFLADWGAEVIHCEHPKRGDIMRGIRDSSVGPGGAQGGKSIRSSIQYEAENHNRNKRSMTLDLSQEGGREILFKLLKTADVFLSNFRPREIQKFKLDYETLSQLNPRLVHANVYSYGRKGPFRDAPGYDFLAFWARAGLLHVFSKPGAAPFITSRAFGDRMTGLSLALGIMTALFVRERTGLGQEVDVSLFNTGVFAITSEVGGSLVTGEDLQQADRKEMLNAAATYYQTKDGRWLRLGMAQADLYWTRFCRAIGRPDLEHDPRFNSYEPRTLNHATLFDILEGIFPCKTLAEWTDILTEAGLPWAPVQSLPEVTRDPQARANGFFESYDHPTYGRVEVVANPIKLSRTPATNRRPAPEFGQHTEEVLLEHGYTWEDIEAFKDRNIIA